MLLPLFAPRFTEIMTSRSSRKSNLCMIETLLATWKMSPFFNLQHLTERKEQNENIFIFYRGNLRPASSTPDAMLFQGIQGT